MLSLELIVTTFRCLPAPISSIFFLCLKHSISPTFITLSSIRVPVQTFSSLIRSIRDDINNRLKK
ncbi:hypothetical protein PanWU01x14_303890 [Parasponia andersonii]|uniref:Uncharacterized protein n=1 Tax=Parasponia andersonii TaxID=3476 RepID=A0A2P5ASV5_PARAD|nr:hypothetical protein PanWU01x14_303890 [Parasponia andersonii]